MKNFLNLKILIAMLISILVLSATLYILFAPETWWKPVYIRILDETNVSEVQSQVSSQDVISPDEIPEGIQPISHIKTGQPSGIMYELGTKVVNLAEPGGLRYLQASIALELWPLIENYSSLEEEDRIEAEEEFRNIIDRRKPVIDDLVTTILASKNFNEIATIEGKQALKEELATAINNALGYKGVINVYFTEFIVQ